MEIDMFALIVIAWASCLGWKRRGLNALMDFMAYSVVGIVVMDIIPISQTFVLGSSLQTQLIDWVQYHLNSTTPRSATYFHIMNAIPVGTGMYKMDVEILHKIYEYGMTFIIGITLFISIHMVRRSFITIWPSRKGLWDSRLAGSVISGLLAVCVVLYVATVLALFTWFSGFSWLDQTLQESLFIHVLSNFLDTGHYLL